MTTGNPFRILFCFVLLLLAACGTPATEEETPTHKVFVPDKTNTVDLDSMILADKKPDGFKKTVLCETENKEETVVAKSYREIGKKTHSEIRKRFRNAFKLKTDDEQLTGERFSNSMKTGAHGGPFELETTNGETVKLDLRYVLLAGEPQLIAAKGGMLYTKREEREEDGENVSIHTVRTKSHRILCTYKAIYRVQLSVTYYGSSTIRKTVEVDQEVLVNRFGGWY